MSDDAKKLILARRARFVAATLAGVGIACGKEPAPAPEVCLSVPMTRDAQPMPCLEPLAVPIDAGAEQDAGTSHEADAGGKPMPCLAPPPATVTAPPTTTVPPRPCLTPVRPKDKIQR
jgi:hypothetical protein